MTQDRRERMRRYYEELAITHYSLLPEAVGVWLRDHLPADEQAFIDSLSVAELRLIADQLRRPTGVAAADLVEMAQDHGRHRKGPVELTTTGSLRATFVSRTGSGHRPRTAQPP